MGRTGLLDVVIDLRDGGDWSLDLCFAGLVKNLGPYNVVDCPTKIKHREWGYGEPDWGKERRTLGYTPLNDLVWSGSGSVAEYEITLAAKHGMIRRVWLDERPESFAKYKELGLYDQCISAVVVAGHDRFWNVSPQFVASLYGDRLEAMLLDNWYPHYADLPFRTRRIGWSCNFDHYWTRPPVAPEKDIDICFVGYNSHPDRARFIDHIESKCGHLRNHIYLERRQDTFDEFIPKQMMFDIMQRSRICLNLRGAADRGKTLRAYEIPYVGSFMLSQDVDDPGMKEDFFFGSHCEYFRYEEDLDYWIDWALRNDSIREEVAAAGHARAIGPLSVKERWKSVLEWLNRT